MNATPVRRLGIELQLTQRCRDAILLAVYAHTAYRLVSVACARRVNDAERAVETSWTLGRLYLHLNPSQRKIYDSYQLGRAKNIKYVVNCSRKLGKSVLGLFVATEVAIRNKDALIAYIAPTVDNVQAYTRQLIQVVFKTCPEHLKPKFMKASIDFPNGSRILFRGVGKGIADSYHNLRSFAFDLIVLDEAGFSANLDEIVDGALLSTLLPRNGNMLLLSTPPVTPDHAFKQYCDEAKLDGAYSEFTIRDSHYTKEQQDKFIKAVGGETSAKAQREYFCKFVIDTDFQIIPEWNDKYIQVAGVQRDKNWKYWFKYLSLDPGWSDHSVCIFGWYNRAEKKLKIKGEIMTKSPEQTTRILADKIKAKEAEIFEGAEIKKRISDNNDPKLLRDFNIEHKLYFSPVESKTALEVMVSDVRELVKDDGLEVDPACTQLIGCLRNGVFTKTKAGNRGKEFARSKAFGHYDAIAALIYLVRELDQTTNPLPPVAERDDENMYVPPKIDEAAKGSIKDIVGAGLDAAMAQEFRYQDHEESWD